MEVDICTDTRYDGSDDRNEIFDRVAFVHGPIPQDLHYGHTEVEAEEETASESIIFRK